jgi:N-acetylglucosamine kinase-like BadF-type ATPase
MPKETEIPRAVLALDPGGSKCEALLVRGDGEVIAAGRAQRAGVSGRSPEIMGQAARQALGGRQVRELHLAAYGWYDPNVVLKLGLVRPAVCHALSEPDGLMALAGEEHGIAVIAGTGARVAGLNRSGKYLTLDGLGPQLGDAGGGYQVGVMALRAAALAERHPRHATSMRERVFEHCLGYLEKAGVGVPPRLDIHQVPREAMARFLALDVDARDPTSPRSRIWHLVEFSLLPQDRSVIAALARVVDEEAERGDAVAARVLGTAAEGLAETVWDLVDLLGMHGEEYPLIAGGSLPLRSRIYWERFRARLAERTPRLRPARAPWPPVVGNALVALLQLNPGREADARARLYESARAFHDATPAIP